MNSITIAGNLGKDSELRSIPSGEQVLIFSAADSQGRDKPTTWWNCQLWGKRAASLQQYLVKGQQVTVSGNVTEREWIDKEGQKRKSFEVRVNDVALQGGKQESRQETPVAKTAPAATTSSGFDDMDDGSIPF